MEQQLELRPQTPIVIETAHGMIKLHRDTSKRGHRLRLEMPPGVRAFIGEGRAWDNARYLMRDGDGAVLPRYNLLVPVVSEGTLVGLESPRVLKVAAQEIEHVDSNAGSEQATHVPG